MKRIIAVFLVLCCVASGALADVFGDFTYEELLILHHALDQEIMQRPEWKEVTVPAGDWIVGVDIPAGDYSIRPVKTGYIRIRDTHDDTFYNSMLKEGEIIGKMSLKEGYTVRLNDAFIFSPAKGLDF